LAHGAQVRQRRAVAVPPEELAMRSEQRLGPVAQREQRFFGAEPAARLGKRHDLVGRHRVGAGLARVATERAVAAVVATERRQRAKYLGREGDRLAAAVVAELSGARQQVAERRRRRLDELGCRLMRDHFRLLAFFADALFAGARKTLFVGSPRPAGAPRPRRPSAPNTLGLPSCAKRSMFASTARSSCTV